MTREEAMAILEVSKHMATSGRLYNQAIDMAIELLKAEPTDTDLISRKSLNDIKFIAIKGDKVEEAYRSGWNGAIECIIENAPCEEKLAEREWIPCSERLPDIDTSVIICTASGNITDGYRWNEKDWFLAWSEYNGWHEGNDEGRITAWMPLPKPYKGGAE